MVWSGVVWSNEGEMGRRRQEKEKKGVCTKDWWYESMTL